MKTCPKCNSTLNGVDDIYCYRDGSLLVEQLTHSCGRQLGPHDKFCPKCGDSFEQPYKPTKEELRADDKLLDHLNSMRGM
jgi:hypothetical protein